MTAIKKFILARLLKGQSHKLLAKIIAEMRTENGKQKLKRKVSSGIKRKILRNLKPLSRPFITYAPRWPEIIITLPAKGNKLSDIHTPPHLPGIVNGCFKILFSC